MTSNEGAAPRTNEGELARQLPELVSDIVGRIGHKYRFGPHEVEDLVQEGYLLAREALPKYDGRTSLRSFLYSVLHSRLCNLKRSQYERRETPCSRCPLGAYHKSTDTCLAFEDKQDCEYWRGWIARNEQKRSLNLTFAAEGCSSGSSRESCPQEIVDSKDLLDFLEDRVLDVRGLRILRKGGHLSEERHNALMEEVQKWLPEED